MGVSTKQLLRLENMIKLVSIKYLILTSVLLMSCNKSPIIYDKNNDDFRYEKGILVYKNSPYDGKLIKNTINGDLESIETYLNGKLNGKLEKYYLNGKLLSSSTYKDGLEDGLMETFDFKGNLSTSMNFENGKRQGIRKIYYDDGKLKGYVNFENDQKYGLGEFYYRDGSIKSKFNFRNDLDYDVIDYYPNGEYKEILKWYSGKKGGQRKSFFENGQLHKIEELFHDGQVSDYMEYNEKGEVIRKPLYLFDNVILDEPDKKNESESYFYENGQIQKIEYFNSKGQLIGCVEYNKEGDKLEEYVIILMDSPIE